MTDVFTTMKRARDKCPKTPAVRDAEGRLLSPALPVVPFRKWARKAYAAAAVDSLSPKLRRVVHGKSS